MVVFFSGLFFYNFFLPASFAGLNEFTELDYFENWSIERKVDLNNDLILCRASMPKHGAWFGARVRLDKDENIVIPDELSHYKLPKNYPVSRLRRSLRKCRESLIYSPSQKH